MKTTLHRARKAMSAYDAERAAPSAERFASHQRVLERFLAGLATHDVAAIEQLLSDDVCALSDGGEFLAARRPILGASRVARMYVSLARKRTGGSFSLRTLNGLPALVAVFDGARPGEASRVVTRCDLDRDGKIVAVHSILATAKIAHLFSG